MKKLSLMIAALALAGVACGDSDSKKSDSDAGNGGGMDGGGNGVVIPGDDAGGGGGDPFPECNKDDALAALGMAGMPWGDMPKPWTQAELMDCTAKCTDGTLQCFIDMCDGQDFVDCFTGELGYCAADAENAPCRDDFATIACCTDKEMCLGTQDEFNTCIGAGGPCEDYLQGYVDCSGMNRTCQNAAVTACVAPGGAVGDAGSETDAGSEADAGADAGTTPAVAQSFRGNMELTLRALAQNALRARGLRTQKH